MMADKNIRCVYFIGIGGIGMSALSRYFNATGKAVAGYDRVRTDLTALLESEGISVHYNDDPEAIPGPFRIAESTMVVYTPAVPAELAEIEWFRKSGFTLYKRSEVLGFITREKQTVAVAGTHGKTTVSTMIAHLLNQCNHGCNAFLGGISVNYNSNLLLKPDSPWVVAEADEFDRSFLQLHPYAAVVTSMDPDHLDIYGDTNEMNRAFNTFVSQINPGGIFVSKPGLPIEGTVLPQQSYTYSLTGPADFKAENIRLENGRYAFDLAGPSMRINGLSLRHPGRVNVENAVAACAMAHLLGVPADSVRAGMAGFLGIRRRFEYLVDLPGLVYIDDYAHHPRELEATILSVKELYPNRKITGIFQPHLYTRTRDLAEGFAESLNLLDTLILLDIYPARELPVEGVTADLIYNRVNLREKYRCSMADLPVFLQHHWPEVLITMGAGDIDKLADPIREFLTRPAR